jgi:hypothetical protein
MGFKVGNFRERNENNLNVNKDWGYRPRYTRIMEEKMVSIYDGCRGSSILC